MVQQHPAAQGAQGIPSIATARSMQRRLRDAMHEVGVAPGALQWPDSPAAPLGAALAQ